MRHNRPYLHIIILESIDMKNVTIIFILFFLVKINCNSQNTSDSYEIWTIASISMGQYYENNTYSTLHDTTINLKTYKAIYQSKDSTFNITNSEYFCAYGIIDRKWYFIPEGQTDEYLLYDFNLAIEDTVCINNPWINGLTELILFEIDSIQLNEIYYKRFAMGYYDKPSNEPHILEYWIDSIGCSNGLFYSGLTTVDIGYQLLCYHKNDNLLYLNSPDNSCGYLTTGLNQEIIIPEINIYPNPAGNILIIENNNEIKRLAIYDISGRIIDVLHIETTENLIKLDISRYPKCFLISVVGSNFSTTKKIIKE